MANLEMVLVRDQVPEEVVSVRECPMCRALVAEDAIRAHEEFHTRLRRAS